MHIITQGKLCFHVYVHTWENAIVSGIKSAREMVHMITHVLGMLLLTMYLILNAYA